MHYWGVRMFHSPRSLCSSRSSHANPDTQFALSWLPLTIMIGALVFGGCAPDPSFRIGGNDLHSPFVAKRTPNTYCWMRPELAPSGFYDACLTQHRKEGLLQGVASIAAKENVRRHRANLAKLRRIPLSQVRLPPGLEAARARHEEILLETSRPELKERNEAFLARVCGTRDPQAPTGACKSIGLPCVTDVYRYTPDPTQEGEVYGQLLGCVREGAIHFPSLNPIVDRDEERLASYIDYDNLIELAASGTYPNGSVTRTVNPPLTWYYRHWAAVVPHMNDLREHGIHLQDLLASDDSATFTLKGLTIGGWTAPDVTIGQRYADKRLLGKDSPRLTTERFIHIIRIIYTAKGLDRLGSGWKADLEADKAKLAEETNHRTLEQKEIGNFIDPLNHGNTCFQSSIFFRASELHGQANLNPDVGWACRAGFTTSAADGSQLFRQRYVTLADVIRFIVMGSRLHGRLGCDTYENNPRRRSDFAFIFDIAKESGVVSCEEPRFSFSAKQCEGFRKVIPIGTTSTSRVLHRPATTRDVLTLLYHADFATSHLEASQQRSYCY